MRDNENDFLFDDQLYEQGANAFKRGGKEVARKVGRAGRKAIKKATKKTVKSVGKAIYKGGKLLLTAAKALIGALISLGPIALLIIMAVGIVIGIAAIAYDIAYETKGAGQQYSQDYGNTLIYNEDSHTVTYNELNKYNTAVKYYYDYFSKKSYWKYINGTLYSPDNYPEIKDFYEREKNFLLKPELLYSLDESLFDGETRWPEQLIKPVQFDSKLFRTIPLKENGELLALSFIRDSAGKITKQSEVQKSVRDYGLGSVFTYHADKRTLYIEGDYYQEDYYDYSAGRIKQRVYDEPVPFPDYVMEGYPQTIYLIDDVMTMAGDVKYQYNVSSKKFSGLISGETNDPSEPYTKVWYGTESVPYTVINAKGEEETRYHEYDLYRYRSSSSYVYEEMPRIANTKTNETGKQYILDFIESYETNLANTASNFNNLRVVDFVDFLVGGLSYGDLSPGSRVNSAAYNKALTYYDYFLKYAKMYAPRDQIESFVSIMIAIAAQESGGNHEKYVSADRCSVAGCGLMQIEKPGVVITGVSAYNYQTGSTDSMYISSYKDVSSVEDNIRAGCMRLASSIGQYENNIFATIQGYNFGSGAFGDALELAAQEQGISVKQLLQDQTNFSWMSKVQLIHQNPLIYSSAIRNNHPNWPGTYGDGSYLYRILSYYNQSINTLGYTGSGATTSSSSGVLTESMVNVSQTMEDIKNNTTQGTIVDNLEDDVGGIDDSNITSETKDEMHDSMRYEEMYVIKDRLKVTYEFEDDFDKVEALQGNNGTDQNGAKRRYLKIQEDFSASEISTKMLSTFEKAGFGVYKGQTERIRYIFKPEKEALEYTNYVHHLTNPDRVEELFRIAHIMQTKAYYSDEIQTALDLKDMWDEGFLKAVANQDNHYNTNGSLVGSSDFTLPIADKNMLNMISSPFGNRNGVHHNGTDFAYAIGTPIYAMYDGVITKAGADSKGVDNGGGLMVFIEHDNGKETRYMHMSAFEVSTGDRVKAGDCIGYVGNTGASTGPHLHLEILIDGVYVDPETVLSNTIGETVGGIGSSSVIEYATQFIGNPYVWGGNSLTNGVDCSGFTKQIMAHFGITLKRTSSEQYSSDGVIISKDDLKSGDLLFYGYNGVVSHVGIYMGNGKIIHASDENTGICIGNAFPTGGKPYIGAKRVL